MKPYLTNYEQNAYFWTSLEIIRALAICRDQKKNLKEKK